MTSFAAHLASSPTILKAKRAFMRERHWRESDWDFAWRHTALAAEVEAAILGRASSCEASKGTT